MIFKHLCGEPFNYRPWELQKLTVPEVFWLLESPDKRGPSGAVNMSDEEIMEENRRYWSQTPLQRLDEKLDNLMRM